MDQEVKKHGTGDRLYQIFIYVVLIALAVCILVPVGLLNLMQAQQSKAEYGILYAGLVLVMLPTLILYICVQKKLTQGMTVGGLKG